MKVHELRGSGVADMPEDVAFVEPRCEGQARCGALEVTEKNDVVAKSAAFANGVASDDRRSEERPHVDDFGVTLLGLERNEPHRRSAGLGQIEAAVTDRADAPAATLGLVRLVEVVPANHVSPAGDAGRNRIDVRLVVGRTIGTPRNLFVDAPRSPSIAVAGFVAGHVGKIEGRRKVNAHRAVGKRAGRARHLARPSSARACDAAARWRCRLFVRRRRRCRRMRRRRASCAGGAGRDQSRRHGQARKDPAPNHTSSIAPLAARGYRTTDTMAQTNDPQDTLSRLFEAERSVRARHREALALPKDKLIAGIRREVDEATKLERPEQALRLTRLAYLLSELEGGDVADSLVDLLGSDEPEARAAAGEALQAHAFDRFKEVALAIERALKRLPTGHLALAELPYVIAEVPEPGVTKLLGLFLAHSDPEAVAGALEACVETGDASMVPAIEPLVNDSRKVQMEDEEGEENLVTIGELATEALEILGDGDDDERG